MFYERLDCICKKKGTTVTGVAKELKISTSNVTNWKSGTIPKGEVVIRLAELLDVSCDYLLLGKESTPKATAIEMPKQQLTESEEDMLKVFRKLTTHQQCKLIVRAEDMIEENEQSKPQENVG